MSGKFSQRNQQGAHRILKGDPLAIRVLKDEHHVFRQLFDKVETADTSELPKVAAELCMRLAVHMTIEEEILYPALKPVIGEDEVNEGIVEHQSGKRLVAEIEQLSGEEELYQAKLHVLGEETIHHIDEEDEDMFAEAAEAHRGGKIDLEALGEKLRARQAELYDDIEKTGELGKTNEAEAEEIEEV
jgi:hypothetical protein